MKFRPQRGSLADSMEAIVELPPSMAALRQHLEKTFSPFPVGPIKVEHYCFDDRIDWDTYIVTVGGQGIGFTDGPVIAE